MKFEKSLLNKNAINEPNEIEILFREFFRDLEVPKLLKDYLDLFGSLDPSKHEKFVPEEAKRATITPISIIFFENSLFKLSIRELHKADKIVASDSKYYIKALTDISLEIYKFDLNNLLNECWDNQLYHKNRIDLLHGEYTTITEDNAFYYSGEVVKLVLILEQKPQGSTRAIYNSSTLTMERIASNSIENDRRNEALKALITILDKTNINLLEEQQLSLSNLLSDRFFSIRWNTARLLINNSQTPNIDLVINKLGKDNNDFIRNAIKNFSEEK